jgi:hypothetical protein
MPAKGLAGRTKSEAARQRKDPMQNLKPFTKENAAEMGRKGGAASQKVQKKKKKLKQCLAAILELEPSERNKEKLIDMGLKDEELSNQMLLAATMFNKATRGDVRAAEFIRDLTGQQPVTSLDRARTKLMNAQAEQIKRQGDPSKELTKLDLLLRAMDTVAGDDSGTD